MKEGYIKPQTDVEEFKTTDIVTTSGGEGSGGYGGNDSEYTL